MAVIRANMAEISTEFKPVEPNNYQLEVVKIEDILEDPSDPDSLKAKVISSKITDPGDMQGRQIRDYINLRTKDGEWNEIGLGNVKRYFEVICGKDEVATWEDEDYDTDKLLGGMFLGQVTIEYYTPKGETEARPANRFKRMESIS